MRFLETIIDIVVDISNKFLGISRWFRELPLISHLWPVPQIADGFLTISDYFFDLLNPLIYAYDWVLDVAYKIMAILDFDTIKELLRDWLDWAQWAWEWVRDAWYYVIDWINQWWLATQATVKGWIEAATEGFDELRSAWDNFWTLTWPEFVNTVLTFRAEWDDFWTNTFPSLVSFSWLTTWFNSKLKEIQDLITSAFTEREPFWAGWQEIRDSVFEFFSDPWQWVYDRLDEFFERFW